MDMNKSLYLSKKRKMKIKINVELIQIVKSWHNQGIIRA